MLNEKQNCHNGNVAYAIMESKCNCVKRLKNFILLWLIRNCSKKLNQCNMLTSILSPLEYGFECSTDWDDVCLLLM